MTACAVSVALVLALDVSGSVSTRHYELQRDATAAALVSPAVVRAVEQQDGIAVRVTAFGSAVHTLAEWHVVASAADLTALARTVAQSPRPEAGQTNIAAALHDAADAFGGLRCHAARQVVDVSGDGEANAGDPEPARERLRGMGVIINALPIETASEPRVVEYFRDHIATGFVIPATWASFGEAIIRKISMEVADAR